MCREHWITKVNKSVINIKGLVKMRKKTKGDSLKLYTMPTTKTVHSKPNLFFICFDLNQVKFRFIFVTHSRKSFMPLFC